MDPLNGKEQYSRYFMHRGVVEESSSWIMPEYLLKVFPEDRNTRILDVGCGFGHLLGALRREGYVNSEGIDISEQAFAECIRKDLKVALIRDLPSYIASKPIPEYDIVIMSHLLEHIEKPTIIPTLRAIREKLLVTGGSVLVMVPNAQSATGCYWAYEDFTHTTLFTAGSLLFVLKAAGFVEFRFLDPEGLEGGRLLVRIPKKLFLLYYKAKIHFWNLVTNSSFHRPSPQIFTYDLKVLAR